MLNLSTIIKLIAYDPTDSVIRHLKDDNFISPANTHYFKKSKKHVVCLKSKFVSITIIFNTELYRYPSQVQTNLRYMLLKHRTISTRKYFTTEHELLSTSKHISVLYYWKISKLYKILTIENSILIHKLSSRFKLTLKVYGIILLTLKTVNQKIFLTIFMVMNIILIEVRTSFETKTNKFDFINYNIGCLNYLENPIWTDTIKNIQSIKSIKRPPRFTHNAQTKPLGIETSNFVQRFFKQCRGALRKGIDLSEDSFTHGQFYVACSRISSPTSLVILDLSLRTTNVVHKECYNN
ncbi:ATP-dependent DNA helicase RRM3-like [Aphis craccivora]|uniref:ATP-dependent DNA helicase RRM3-like n=1 Tax=Aphis craccivora TaxID=307492 RepID=A0A6G0ZPQ7_APHCR|nr:ATP-dependent DNA helicase RRM3-like [Aphis craccivora]